MLETRPWGSFETVLQGDGYLVKRLTINPGKRFSLQRHHHRAETWVVVGGTGLITCGAQTFSVGVADVVTIPLGAVHRAACTSEGPLVMIEVQLGTTLEESDIERLEDDFGRK